jgi:hypothetical protein
MGDFSLHQFFVIYTWFPLAALLFFMLLIARFFQKFSNNRMYFWFYLLPIIFYGGAVVRYASVRRLAGDPLADFLLGVAGIFLLLLSLRLYQKMIWHNQPDTIAEPFLKNDDHSETQ